MSTADILKILGLGAPIFSTFICSLMLSIFYLGSPKGEYRKVIGWDLPAMSGALFCWVSVLLAAVNNKALVSFHSIAYIMFMIDTVFLYRLVYLLTDRDGKRRFPRQHYIVPIVLGLIMALWSSQVPFETKAALLRNENVPNMPLFSLFYNSGALAFFIYTVLYSALSLRRIYYYRKEVVNYSADEKTSVRWLYMVFLLIGMSLPASALAFFTNEYINYPITLLTGFMFVFQHVLIPYNLVGGNYVLILSPGERERTAEAKIDRKKFEAYIRTAKPYLNPSLRITDICLAVEPDRSYLSEFINREYGMNFAAYINRCRMEELERIRLLPKHNHINGLDMILDPGFGSYRNYLRVKKKMEEESTLKLD